MSEFPLRDKCEEKAKRLKMSHFTLIASDNSAIPTILEWIGRNDGTLADDKYREAKAIVTAMGDWRTMNPGLCKNPD